MADTFVVGRGVPIGNSVRPTSFIIKEKRRLLNLRFYITNWNLSTFFKLNIRGISAFVHLRLNFGNLFYVDVIYVSNSQSIIITSHNSSSTVPKISVLFRAFNPFLIA